MKYMLTWTERPQGSPIEYENAQKRILEVFTKWQAPVNFKIELFVIRVGDWGGYMMLDCDDPLAVHKFCSMLPAFIRSASQFQLWTRSGSSLKRLLRDALGRENDASRGGGVEEYSRDRLTTRLLHFRGNHPFYFWTVDESAELWITSECWPTTECGVGRRMWWSTLGVGGEVAGELRARASLGLDRRRPTGSNWRVPRDWAIERGFCRMFLPGERDKRSRRGLRMWLLLLRFHIDPI